MKVFWSLFALGAGLLLAGFSCLYSVQQGTEAIVRGFWSFESRGTIKVYEYYAGEPRPAFWIVSDGPIPEHERTWAAREYELFPEDFRGKIFTYGWRFSGIPEMPLAPPGT